MNKVRNYFRTYLLAIVFLFLSDFFYQFFLLSENDFFIHFFHFLSMICVLITPYVFIVLIVYHHDKDNYITLILCSIIAYSIMYGLFETIINEYHLIQETHHIQYFYDVFECAIHECLITQIIIIFHNYLTQYLMIKKKYLSVNILLSLFSMLLGIVYFLILFAFSYYIMPILGEGLIYLSDVCQAVVLHFIKLICLQGKNSFLTQTYSLSMTKLLFVFIIPIIIFLYRETNIKNRVKIIMTLFLLITAFASEPLVLEYFLIVFFPGLYLALFIPLYIIFIIMNMFSICSLLNILLLLMMVLWEFSLLKRYFQKERRLELMNLFSIRTINLDEYCNLFLDFVGGEENMLTCQLVNQHVEVTLLDYYLLNNEMKEKLNQMMIVNVDNNKVIIYSYGQSHALYRHLSKYLFIDEFS